MSAAPPVVWYTDNQKVGDRHRYVFSNSARPYMVARVYLETNEAGAANARLIEAAPELFSAACDLIAYCDKNPPMGESLWSVQRMRAAVAKIKGDAA